MPTKPNQLLRGIVSSLSGLLSFSCFSFLLILPAHSNSQQTGWPSQSAQNRLAALLSLENEINAYLRARNDYELQQRLDPPQWVQLAENLLAVGQDVTPGAARQFEIVNGTIKYKPPEDEPDRPVWQDGDTDHLYVLLALIRYDSKRLGMNVTTIGPRAEGTNAMLSRLIGKINVERDNIIQGIQSYATKQEQSSVLAQYHALLDATNSALLEVKKQETIVQACLSRCDQLPTLSETSACQKPCQVPFDNAIAASDRANKALYSFQDIYHCLGEVCIIPRTPH